MARYSRAAVFVLAEGAFWSEPRDAEHWKPAPPRRGGSLTRSFLSYLGANGLHA